MTNEVKTLKEAAQIIKEYIDDIGGCEHHVGVCCCHLIKTHEELLKLIKQKEG